MLQWQAQCHTVSFMLTPFESVEDKILIIRDMQVLIDRDVAGLYDVETRDINKAVKNNPDKFPEGYVIELTLDEFADLRRKFSTAKFAKTRVLPKAFTEKGLYMLATILKGPRATNTTIAIVETFSKMRNLSRSVRELSQAQDKQDQQALMQKSGELLKRKMYHVRCEMLIPSNILHATHGRAIS